MAPKIGCVPQTLRGVVRGKMVRTTVSDRKAP